MDSFGWGWSHLVCNQPSTQLKEQDVITCCLIRAVTPQADAIDECGVMKEIGEKSLVLFCTLQISQNVPKNWTWGSAVTSQWPVCVALIEVNHCTIQKYNKPCLPVMVIYTSIVANTILVNAWQSWFATYANGHFSPLFMFLSTYCIYLSTRWGFSLKFGA